MKKLLKNILPEIILILVVSVCLGVSYLSDKPASVSSLDSLNTKFGLVSAQALDKDSERMSLLFRPEVLSASVIKISRPEKSLLLQLKDAEESEFKNIYLIKFRTDFDIDEIAKAYQSLELIRFAEPDYKFELSSSQSKPTSLLKSVAGVSDTGKKSVTVAIIDSGVDPNHKDLKGRFVSGWDFLDNDNIPQDNFGHGTHLAGIIAKSPFVAIMPIRITNAKTGKLSDLIKSIKFAVDNKAEIINLSLGLPNSSDILKEVINYAVKKNVTVVAAAGNYNTQKEYYPAAYPNVISVAALDNNGDKLFVSDYGKWVDYSVSAQDVYSTLPGGKYGYKTGTSQAAAIVTADIASILGKNGNSDLSAELQNISSPVKLGDYAGLLGRKLQF